MLEKIKKNKGKVIFIILLVVCLIFAGIATYTTYKKENPDPPSVEDIKEVIMQGGVEKQANSNDLQYSISEKQVTILGFKEETTTFTLVTIPEKIEGYPVVAIADGAFKNCLFLETIVLGNEIKTVGIGAFENCPKLKMVVFGTSTETIKENAFNSCVALSSVSLGNGIKTVEKGAFKNTTVDTVFFPDSIEFVDDDAFEKSITVVGKNGGYAENWSVENNTKFKAY